MSESEFAKDEVWEFVFADECAAAVRRKLAAAGGKSRIDDDRRRIAAVLGKLVECLLDRGRVERTDAGDGGHGNSSWTECDDQVVGR